MRFQYPMGRRTLLKPMICRTVQGRTGQDSAISEGKTRKGYENEIKSTFISFRSSMVIQVANLSAMRSSAKLKNQILQVS